MRHDAEALAGEGGSDGCGGDLAGVSGGRLQREVHEVEAVLPDPVDLLPALRDGWFIAPIFTGASFLSDRSARLRLTGTAVLTTLIVIPRQPEEF